MNELDRQDADRYWKISQARCSARVFAEGAETGFTELFGGDAGGAAREAFGAVGSIFYMAGDLLDRQEGDLDTARYVRSHSRIARRQAVREHDAAYEAQRDVVCRTRQFMNSVTGGQGNVYLGVRGPTPRNAEKSAAWGWIMINGLRETVLRQSDLPPEARALAAAFAAELEKLTRVLEEAIERTDEARDNERLDNAYLKDVRETVDEELAKIVAYLRTNLELVGYDYLASRVLGKRRGRPRKSRKKADTAPRHAAESARESGTAPQPAIETARKLDSAPHPAAGAGRKLDSAPQPASEGGRKLDSAEAEEDREAFEEPREIEQAQDEACTAIQEIVEAPNEACTAPEKIAKVLCNPCTEPSQDAEVASFQQDTPRSGRRRRRRVAEALLGASKRLLTSGWMGGFVSGERRRREGSGRD